MLPPEIQRIVLLIGLAATGYLLILAWNQDSEAARTPMQVSAAPMVEQNIGDALGRGLETPTLAAESALNSQQQSDIPTAELLAQAPIPAAAAVVEQPAADRLVVVTTPSLKMWIDLLGGDIVRVQLPGFPVLLDKPDNPYLLLENSFTHTYIAQSGLIGPDGIDKSSERPLYSASAQRLDITEQGTLTLTAQIGDLDVEKSFEFSDEPHLVKVSYKVSNASIDNFSAGMFSQIKRDNRSPPSEESFALAPQPFLGAAFTTEENPYHKVDFDDLEEAPYQEATQGGWVAFLQHYFISAWIAPAEQQTRYYARRATDGNYLFGLTGPVKTLAPGETGQWEAQFYAGPKDQIALEAISDHLNLTVDYGFLWWIAVPLFKALTFFHGLVGNWGFAIILLTLSVKACLYWVSAKGYRSMANMRRVAPAMKRLQERYANDREKLSREMMALYKKEGANPLGGCLPMLLPMPIFLALYWVLLESVELRQAPFLFWINDLSVMDPYFILPLLMGASTYLMQSLNPQVGDPMQVKMMKLMPIMLTVLFLFFPAGLVLYWLVNNLLSIAQQTYVYRQEEKARA